MKMKNSAHFEAGLYLLFETNLNEDEIKNVITTETIINSKVEITLPDGSVHKASFVNLNSLTLVDFEDQNIDKEKATKHIA
ncbi:hypothetical protein KDN24_06735 [Bacillus sp. Bva_UNVM-123]|uniref:hypothetical protein n=1 Tax=Bacillus sp. Bva_UNVM-123 TaxID=2829798 RepID=UPI00391F8860